MESAVVDRLGADLGGAFELDQSSAYGGRDRRQSVLRVDAEAVEVRAPRPDGAPQRLAVGWSRRRMPRARIAAIASGTRKGRAKKREGLRSTVVVDVNAE